MTDRAGEIRSRLAAAPPWPWCAVGQGTTIESAEGLYIVSVSQLAPNFFATADLVVNAPSDIAWLLEERTRLEQDRDDCKAEAARNREEAEFANGIRITNIKEITALYEQVKRFGLGQRALAAHVKEVETQNARLRAALEEISRDSSYAAWAIADAALKEGA